MSAVSRSLSARLALTFSRTSSSKLTVLPVHSERRQRLRNRHVPTFGGVLVAQRGTRCGVPETTHQLDEGGAGGRGEDGPGVSKVVEPEVWASDSLAGPVERLVDRGRCQVALSVRCWEQQTVLPPVMVLRTWSFMSGRRCGGTATSRVPASLFGVLTIVCPSARTTARLMWMTPFLRSMSPLRSSASSPKRNAHQAASSTMSGYFSGRVAATSASSSAKVAGFTLCTRREFPAPRMCAGLTGISWSWTAAPRMDLSSP